MRKRVAAIPDGRRRRLTLTTIDVVGVLIAALSGAVICIERQWSDA